MAMQLFKMHKDTRLVAMTNTQCNTRKRTTTPAKRKGKEANTIRESREWIDDVDAHQPQRRLAAYEEAPARPEPAPRPPREDAKAKGV